MKEFLSQKGIRFSERDVSVDPSAGQESYRVSGQGGIPVIVVDGEVVVGFDRPRLEELLAAVPSAGARRPFGLRVGDASRVAGQPGTVPIFGAYVDRVAHGSPAQQSGLAPGDIVTEVNMRPIGGAGDLEKALASVQDGGRLTIVFVRGNKRLKTEAVV